MKTLAGNTYPIKDQIRQSGGKWDPISKVWKVPEGEYDRLLRLVGEQPQKTSYKYECCDCGDKVAFGSRCWETGLRHNG